MIFTALFEGYQETPNLWNGQLDHLYQFSIPRTRNLFQTPESIPKLRLGKWVEQFVKHQIESNSNCELIADSLQIKKEKQTIGELDFLFKLNSQLIHLELVYKFYLYDHTKTYKSSLEHWIGPNRTDSLVLKLDKLKTKQLPLLHHPSTKEYLNQFHIKAEDCQQSVQFKAQLFLPLKHLDLSIEPLNQKCVSGFHLNINDIHLLEGFKIYIPNKLDWLATPHADVDWEQFSESYKTIEDQCKSHRSPMIWLKDPENNVQKAFVTWW